MKASELTFYEWQQTRVSLNPRIMGGEPTFSGSRLTIRHIGAMQIRHGESVLPEIREDYPYLSEQDIEFAKLYTLVYPLLTVGA